MSCTKRSKYTVNDVDVGYCVVGEYVESNYGWTATDYIVTYKFMLDGLKVYDVSYREGSGKIGGGKSVSVFLDPNDHQVIKVLRAQ